MIQKSVEGRTKFSSVTVVLYTFVQKRLDTFFGGQTTSSGFLVSFLHYCILRRISRTDLGHVWFAAHRVRGEVLHFLGDPRHACRRPHGPEKGENWQNDNGTTGQRSDVK